jgi:hypothetical protein
MNVTSWTQYFLANRGRFVEPPLPPSGCPLPAAVRDPLAASIAVFQLGESGGGTRLMRHVRRTATAQALEGYDEAVGLFIREECYHADLLGRLLTYLGGRPLQKQWSNSVFRHVRNWLGTGFNIQILLTAELVAEAYYGSLYRRVPDAAVRRCCHKILADEMRHIAFHREFLQDYLGAMSPAARWLWRLQFALCHQLAALLVAWEHRHCFKALGMTSAGFMDLCLRTRHRFLRRLSQGQTLWQARAGLAAA